MNRSGPGVLVVVAVVLACLPFACAAPAPARDSFSKGTYVSPAPPPRPGVGAPVVGQPGYVGPLEGLPRSPHGRVLPQDERTRGEDTVWAVNGTEPTDEHDPIVILGRSRLLPVDPSPREMLWVSECALLTRNTFALVASGEGAYEKAQESIKQFGQDGRCIVARFYHMCISYVDNDDRKNKEQLIREGRLQRPSLDRILRLATELGNQECDKARSLAERPERFLNAATRLLRQYINKATKEALP